MARGVLIVESRASHPDREVEYDQWYVRTHIPHVVATPGFGTARRYRLREREGESTPGQAPTYLTIYDLEADDLGAAMAALRERMAAGDVPRSDALQMEPPPVVRLYELAE